MGQFSGRTSARNHDNLKEGCHAIAQKVRRSPGRRGKGVLDVIKQNRERHLTGQDWAGRHSYVTPASCKPQHGEISAGPQCRSIPEKRPRKAGARSQGAQVLLLIFVWQTPAGSKLGVCCCCSLPQQETRGFFGILCGIWVMSILSQASPARAQDFERSGPVSMSSKFVSF